MALPATIFRMAVVVWHYYGFGQHHLRWSWSRDFQRMVLPDIWGSLGTVFSRCVCWDWIPHDFIFHRKLDKGEESRDFSVVYH